MATFVDANVHVDAIETSGRGDVRRADVASPIMVVLQAQGEVLVRKKGERITADPPGATLENARRTSSASFDLRQVLALIFVASLLAFFLYRYSRSITSGTSGSCTIFTHCCRCC